MENKRKRTIINPKAKTQKREEQSIHLEWTSKKKNDERWWETEGIEKTMETTTKNPTPKRKEKIDTQSEQQKETNHNQPKSETQKKRRAIQPFRIRIEKKRVTNEGGKQKGWKKKEPADNDNESDNEAKRNKEKTGTQRWNAKGKGKTKSPKAKHKKVKSNPSISNPKRKRKIDERWWETKGMETNMNTKTKK